MSVPTKREIIFDSDKEMYPSKLIEFKAFVDAQLAKVPEEYHKDITLDIEAYDNYGSASHRVEIYYYKPLTAEEIKNSQDTKERNRLETIARLKKALENLGETV